MFPDEDENAESSPAIDDAALTTKVDTPANAESSPATDDNEGVVSIVRDVVDTRKEKAASASSAESVEGEKPSDSDDPGAKKQDDENFSDVPFHKHPRFRQVLSRLHAAEPDAVRYRNVENFLAEQGLEADEAADALKTAALIKSNPTEAWKRLEPVVRRLLAETGEVLSDDLKQRVQGGELSLEAAKEVSRSRAAVKSVETQRTFEQKLASHRAQTEAQTSVVKTVTDWFDDRQVKDPNFDAKLQPLQEKIAFYNQTEGYPKDATEARERLKKAYKAVNEQLASVTPIDPARRKKAVQPVTGGQVAGTTRAEPKSTLDIINGVTAQRRSA